MLNNALLFVAVSLLSGCFLLYIHAIGTIVKNRFSNTPSSIPSIFLGIITLFSLVYLLTMATLYVNGLAHILHYFFLVSIGVTLYLVRRSKIPIFNRNIVENCVIFSVAIFLILIYQFYPYAHLTNDIPTNNFLHDLPFDNVISLMFANSLLNGELLEFGDWLGSDRPPLFAGTILFLNATQLPVDQVYLLIGIAVQAILIPVVSEFVAGLSKRKLTIPEKLFLTFIVISTPVFIHNVAFLWPKLFAAIFMIIAVDLLFFQPEKSIRLTILTSISMLLSFLAHGGSGFAILAVALIYIAGIRKKEELYRGFLIAAVFFAGYSPWIFYQKVVQPPGDRLLKWHILGQIDIVPEGVGPLFITKIKEMHFFDIPVRTYQSFHNQILEGFTLLWNAPSFALFTEQSFYRLPLSVGAPLFIAAIFLLFLKDKVYNSLMLIALVNAIVWFALPFKPVWSIHESTYFLPIMIITAGVYGVFNLHSGKLPVMLTLVGFGMANMVIMDWHRMHLYESTHLVPHDLYKMVNITNYDGGTDFDKTKKENILILGSHLTADTDTADFTFSAVNGDAIYYITGPDAIGQTLEVYGDGKRILELTDTKIDEWKRLDVGRYEKLQVRLVDNGKNWGQWSAIAVRK
tara:strand:+ start:93860 stop:95749 length:1890 start_codon:yes stop_codon:yes gene_type:complete